MTFEACMGGAFPERVGGAKCVLSHGHVVFIVLGYKQGIGHANI